MHFLNGFGKSELFGPVEQQIKLDRPYTKIEVFRMVLVGWKNKNLLFVSISSERDYHFLFKV